MNVGSLLDEAAHAQPFVFARNIHTDIAQTLQPAHFRYFLHKISEMNILQPDPSANPNISKIRAEESSGGATPCTPLAPMF